MTIIELDPKQKRKAAEVVASAFLDYPMFTHYFPSEKRRKRWLPWYMKNTLNCALRYGKVFVTSDFSGVMFVLPPNHTRLTNGDYIKNGFLLAPLIVGLKNYFRNDACEKFIADTHEQILSGREHYYLWGLVADPNTQRKGVGTALMKILTDAADAENKPVYLETHDKNNVAYYEKFGFELVKAATIPGQGVDIWCMLRETKKS